MLSVLVPQQPLRAIALSLALLGSCVSLSVQAAPSSASQRQHYQIAAGQLSDVLARFAAQSGVQLSLDPAIAAQPSKGLSGSYTVGEGFAILLAHSALELINDGHGNYTVRMQQISMLPAVDVTAIKPLARVASAGDVTLPAVEVNASEVAETATSPVQGYVAKRSATATKTDTPIVETPQSISVVGQEELKAQGASTLNAALRYVPGVAVEIAGNDDRQVDWLSIRGFDTFGGTIYQDGLKMSATNEQVVQNEVYGSERVEVLRGNSASIYGAGDVGGIINRVSKRPNPDHVNELGLTVGTRQTRQLRADLGGGLGGEKQAWRMVGLLHHNQPQADFPGIEEPALKRLYLAPSLSLALSDNTDLTLLASLAKMRNTYNAGELLTAENGNSGKLYGLPNFDRGDAKRSSIGYELEHRFSDSLRLRQHLRLTRHKDHYQLAYADSYRLPEPPNSILTGTLYANRDDRQDQAVDTHLIGKFQHGNVSHTVLAGVDFLRGKSRADQYIGPAPDLDLNAPDYTPFPAVPDTLRRSRQTELTQLGLYLQDQIAIGSWRFSGGLRHDQVRKETHDLLVASLEQERDKALTGRIGANYVFGNGLVPYASYGTSFQPQGGQDRQGRRFEPLRGKQFELGLKYQPTSALQFAGALFDLRKQNVLTSDPVNPNFQVMHGEIRARGLELEARGELAPGLNLIASYTYTDSVFSKDNDGNQGNKVNGTSPHNASAWLDYTVQGGDLRGLGGGVGGRYQGSSERAASNDEGKDAAYTLYDAALWYKVGPWTTRLNASNLTDANVAGSTMYAFARVARRSINLSVDYLF